MSRCTEALVPTPWDTRVLYVLEGSFATLECPPDRTFPTTDGGIYWCVGDDWTGIIPECIPRPSEDPETSSVQNTTTESPPPPPTTTATTTTITTTKHRTTTTPTPTIETTTTEQTTTTTQKVTTSTTTEQQPVTETTTTQQPVTTTTTTATTTTTTTDEAATSQEASMCTEDLVPIPDGTRLLHTDEGKFALLECEPGYKFPTSTDGAYFCVNNQWSGNITACIPREAAPTSTTTGSTTTTRTTTRQTTRGDGFTVCQNCAPSTTEEPGAVGMNDMSKTLLGVGLGLIVVLFIVGLCCFICSVLTKRKKRREEEEQNYRNKRAENNNTLDKALNDGSLLVDGHTAVWVSSGSIYGGGTYVPIPARSEGKSDNTYLSPCGSDTKSDNTYLSVDPLSEKTVSSTGKKSRPKNSTNRERDDENAPDTRRLILRYSTSSSLESSPTITPPSTRSSSYLMLPPEEGASTTGYDRQGSPPVPPRPTSSFPGSDVSLTSLYGVDAGVYDSILTDLEPMYLPHALADTPAKRRPSIGHCI